MNLLPPLRLYNITLRTHLLLRENCDHFKSFKCSNQLLVCSWWAQSTLHLYKTFQSSPFRLQEAIHEILNLRLDISEVNGPTSPAGIQNKASEDMLSVLIIPLLAVQTLSAGEYPAHDRFIQRGWRGVYRRRVTEVVWITWRTDLTFDQTWVKQQQIRNCFTVVQI